MPFVILPTNSISGGYDITNSLRFNSGSSDSLTRTTGTPTSQQKFTCSAWCKRTNVGTFNIIQTFYTDANNYLAFDFLTSDRLDVINYAGATTARKITTAVFRDVSAWYHIVASVDTTLATANDRIKIYVNGTLQTAFDTNTAPSQNANLLTNATTTAIGVGEGGSIGYHNGYISEIYYIDGQALTPSSFGETDFDTGIWKPKAYTGTYGTKGYYLQFKNSASLGTDSSGNGNTFTVNNLTSIDQTTDTPTNNFATINALENYYSGLTLSESNLKGVTTNAYYSLIRSTIGVSKGKWYVEAKCNAQGASENKWHFGISDFPPSSSTSAIGTANYSYGWRGEGNTIFYNGTSTSYGTEGGMSTGMIVGIALDLDNNKIYWSRNGTWKNSANPATNTNGFSITGASSTNTGFYHFAFGDYDGDYGYTYETNFGNPPYSANSYTDGAGYGNFSYAVPSGYYSLNTKNLATFG
jgi:hypothetical protein